MLSWEKIDAIPGWFMFQSYCVWRALLDQQARITGDLFEIGVWRGRSASVLASYRKGDEKLYLCDLRLDEEAVHRAIRSVGAEPVNIVPLSGPSADLPAKLDLQAMHQTVRWFHIDGEHTGTAVYRELELANRIVNADGIVVIDDFFSPRYPANTTEVIRYLEKNPFHFRLLAVGFNKGYLCRPESLPRYMDFMASGMSRALGLRRQDDDLQDHRAVGHRCRRHHRLRRRRGPDRRPRQRAATLAHDAHAPRLGAGAAPAERLADVAGTVASLPVDGGAAPVPFIVHVQIHALR